jgi:hypothetical protein
MPYTKSKLNKLKVKFEGAELIEKSNSQACQEMFVLSVLNGKRNGSYLEVGAYHSSTISNTHNLEKIFGWQGLSLDKAKKCVDDWKENRSGKFLLCDATTLDYKEAMENAGLPKHVDYLQLDIDPSHITYKALLRVPFEDYKFSIITFEHDIFRAKENHAEQVRKDSREYIQSKGYVLVAGDVAGREGKPFEDWYVSKEIAESEFFKNHFQIVLDFNGTGDDYVMNKKVEAVA